MASESEEVLCLSLAEEKDAKEIVDKQDNVRDDKRGDDVIFTSTIQIHRHVVNSSTNDKLTRERGRERGWGREREG